MPRLHIRLGGRQVRAVFVSSLDVLGGRQDQGTTLSKSGDRTLRKAKIFDSTIIHRIIKLVRAGERERRSEVEVLVTCGDSRHLLSNITQQGMSKRRGLQQASQERARARLCLLAKPPRDRMDIPHWAKSINTNPKSVDSHENEKMRFAKLATCGMWWEK